MAEDNGTNHSIELTESIGVDGSIEVNLRSYFSHNHILSAAYLAREAGKLEAEHTDDLPDQAAERDEVWTTHQSHVITSLISSVSFLESTVLELFTDICDDGQRVEELDPEFCRKVQVLDAYADGFLNGLSTIEKFQLALDLDGSQRFDTGAQPYRTRIFSNSSGTTCYTTNRTPCKHIPSWRTRQPALLAGSRPRVSIETR